MENKLPKLCSKLTFRRLLLKLKTGNTFMLNSKFYKQVDGCYVGGPHSVTFSNIYMTKTEKKEIEPTKPQFYRRFLDDIINKRYKDQPDNLFQALNNNHPKIKYTIEVDSDKFLDTKIIHENGIVTTEINQKDITLPVNWTSRIPKRYKRNSITSDLNLALRISSCLKDEISKIRQKILNADYPLRFVNKFIKQFNDKVREKLNEKDDYILSTDFFEIKMQVILIEVLYCEKKKFFKCFLKKFHEPMNDLYDIKIKWITKKMKNMFCLKKRNPHPACVIYEGICTYKENYIGETKRNVEIQWEEYSNINKISEQMDIRKAIQRMHLHGKF